MGIIMNEDKDNEQVSEIERAINNAVKLNPGARYLIILDPQSVPLDHGELLQKLLEGIGIQSVVGVIPNPQQSVVVHELHKCRCEEVLEVLNEVQQLRAELNHDPDKFHVAFPGCCK